jgi:RNA polymerase sigma-70 factor, ECF subfamily
MDSLDDPTETEDGMMVPKQLEDWHDDPEKLYAKQQLREIVEQAVQALPPIYREAFVLRDVEDLTTEQAAEALGLSVSALKSRLLRARLMVREALAKHLQRPPSFKSKLRHAQWKIQDVVMAGLRKPSGEVGEG